MSLSLTFENPSDPFPVQFQLALLPEFLGRKLSLVASNVTVPAGTVGPIPLRLALPQNIQSIFPGDYSFIGRLLDSSGGLLSESRVDFTVSAKVSIRDFSFTPQLIVVRVGDNVQWSNNGAVIHTTTSDTGLWSSGDLTPGSSWNQNFLSEGFFPYHCNTHSQMKGGVWVLSGPLSASLERDAVERRLRRRLKADKLKRAIQRTLRP